MNLTEIGNALVRMVDAEGDRAFSATHTAADVSGQSEGSEEMPAPAGLQAIKDKQGWWLANQVHARMAGGPCAGHREASFADLLLDATPTDGAQMQMYKAALHTVREGKIGQVASLYPPGQASISAPQGGALRLHPV